MSIFAPPPGPPDNNNGNGSADGANPFDDDDAVSPDDSWIAGPAVSKAPRDPSGTELGDLGATGTVLAAVDAVDAVDASPDAVVVVVDSDRVTRRFVELALGRDPTIPMIRVETAASIADALEIAGASRVDLVLAASHLRDGEGLELHRRLMQRSHGAALPFVMLSADQRVASKIAALDAGIDDYLVKPCDGNELAARVRSLIRRSRATRASVSRFDLAGELATMPLPDLVAMLELGKRTGVLAVATIRKNARVYFDRGQVVHATLGNFAGVEAFVRLVGEAKGQFEFVATATGLPVASRTVSLPTTTLILEAARLFDEERHGRPTAASRDGGAHWPRGTTQRGATGRAIATAPTPDLVKHFVYGLTEGWVPGELQLLSADALRTWTQGGPAERFHVLLAAEASAGVAAMMALAAPPAEREIIAALVGTPLTITLSLHLRDRLIDVALIDLERPSTFQDALLRTPSLCIVAPSCDDLGQLTARTRVELDGLLDLVAPTTVLGVGPATVEDYFRAFGALRKGGAIASNMAGRLGDGATSLRHILVRGLRLWGTSSVWRA